MCFIWAMVKVVFKHYNIYTHAADLSDLVSSKGHDEVEGRYL
jgi:hypothetical protein